MNRKKVNSVLKGMAVAGAAVGGVNSIQGADVVMAAELENSVTDTTSENEFAGRSESISESLSENVKDSTSVSTSESLVDEESMSVSASICERRLLSESASESTSESAKQSDAAQGSESVASFVNDVTYASARDDSVENSTYKSLEDVTKDNITDSSKTVYELGEDKVLVRNVDKSGVVYYKTAEGTIKELAVDAQAITDNPDGSVTVYFDGYYIDSDGTWKNTTYTDYNNKSGNKVFINGNFVVDKDGAWQEILVDGKSVEYKGDQYKWSWIYSRVQIQIGDEKYYLDGAHVKNGKFYAIPWEYKRVRIRISKQKNMK